MFTGIIEGSGTVAGIRSVGQGKRMTVVTDMPLDDVAMGHSIAVNGACLTAVSIDGNRFAVDISPETLVTTTLGRYHAGHRVNLERALRFSDRLNGHLVSGHIDGTGEVFQREVSGNATLLAFAVPESLSRYIIEKGSVAVDGVSLTVNRCDQRGFGVSIIPHTSKETTLDRLRIGDSVNVETDLIGKYIDRFAARLDRKAGEGESSRPSIDLKLLARNGFL